MTKKHQFQWSRKLGIFLFVLLMIPIFGYIFLESDDSLYTFFHKNSPSKIIESTELGFPIIVDNGNLSIYSFNKKTLKSTNIKIADAGFFSGVGSSSPIASPDFKYSAFIDSEKRDLWILSNETLERTQVTKNGEIAEYITGWSPDGKKIIYVTGRNEVAKIGGGDGEKIVQSKPILENSGEFYLYEIETGSSTKLPDIKYFERFFDSNRILIRPPEGQYGNPGNHIVTFDLNTFKTNASVMPAIYGSEISQYDISKDFRKWTFTFHYNPTVAGDDSNIVLANFPEKEGIIIQSGEWAELQFPKLSPNSTKIAYIRRLDKSDNLTYEIMLYDVATKTLMNVGEGSSTRWFDDNDLIIYSTKDKKYYLLDVVKNNKTPLN